MLIDGTAAHYELASSHSTQFAFSRFDAPAKAPRRSSVGKQSTDVVSASSVEREATIIAIANPPATAQRI